MCRFFDRLESDEQDRVEMILKYVTVSACPLLTEDRLARLRFISEDLRRRRKVPFLNCRHSYM